MGARSIHVFMYFAEELPLYVFIRSVLIIIGAANVISKDQFTALCLLACECKCAEHWPHTNGIPIKIAHIAAITAAAVVVVIANIAVYLFITVFTSAWNSFISLESNPLQICWYLFDSHGVVHKIQSKIEKIHTSSVIKKNMLTILFQLTLWNFYVFYAWTEEFRCDPTKKWINIAGMESIEIMCNMRQITSPIWIWCTIKKNNVFVCEWGIFILIFAFLAFLSICSRFFYYPNAFRVMCVTFSRAQFYYQNMCRYRCISNGPLTQSHFYGKHIDWSWFWWDETLKSFAFCVCN